MHMWVPHASWIFPSYPHCLLALSTLTAGPRPHGINTHPVRFDLYVLECAVFIRSGAVAGKSMAIYRHFSKKLMNRAFKKIIFFFFLYFNLFFPFKMDLRQPGQLLCSSVEERQADQTARLTLPFPQACIIDEHITYSFLWHVWMWEKWEIPEYQVVVVAAAASLFAYIAQRA